MDRRAAEQGASVEGLIGAVGHAVADLIIQSHPACSVLFFCGPGHNGADGLAAACLLAPTHGVTVLMFLKDKMKDAVRIHYERLGKTGRA